MTVVGLLLIWNIRAKSVLFTFTLCCRLGHGSLFTALIGLLLPRATLKAADVAPISAASAHYN